MEETHLDERDLKKVNAWKKYYAANKEKIRDKRRQRYFLQTRTKEIENAKRRQAANIFTYRLRDYKRNAVRTGRPFEISEELAKMLMNDKCYYSNHEANTCNGIDRVDNDKGYEPGNVVPCCHFCNQAKSDKSVESFLTWLRSVKCLQ